MRNLKKNRKNILMGALSLTICVMLGLYFAAPDEFAMATVKVSTAAKVTKVTGRAVTSTGKAIPYPVIKITKQVPVIKIVKGKVVAVTKVVKGKKVAVTQTIVVSTVKGDKNGNYKLSSVMDKGNYQISIQVGKSKPVTKPITITPGKSTSLTLKLNKTGTLIAVLPVVGY
jgi:hypothetical protein